MSNRDPSSSIYASLQSQVRQSPSSAPQDPSDPLLPPSSDRRLHGDSPSRHDIDFYQRKVNRYQVEIGKLEHELSVTRFRLSQAEDYQLKYHAIFEEKQKLNKDFSDQREELEQKERALAATQAENSRLALQVKSLRSKAEEHRQGQEEQRLLKEELREKTESQGLEDRQALKAQLTRQMESIRMEARSEKERLTRQINELKNTIVLKENIENSLSAKLQHIKGEKNSEIARLKELVSSLKNELGEKHIQSESAARQVRALLISETELRIGNVRILAQLIQDTLATQIESLNATLAKKDEEIAFFLQSDKKQLQAHADSQSALKTLIRKLQDKIFTIQRESELELYQTIQRLKAQYQDNLQSVHQVWEETRLAHNALVATLRKEIDDLKKELDMLNSQNRTLQKQCKQMASDQEHSVSMLSQKIIGMQAERDQALKHYTTSMKQIQDDAKTKLDDLHAAMQTKNNQSEILNAQITLKNGEISHLLQEIARLRETNRQKLKKLESTNAAERNALNTQIVDHKRQIQQLKRALHELQVQLADDEAAHQLQQQISARELQAQKEANQQLRARNNFLAGWCAELQRDLKAQRVANVNILHDQNLSQRENIQVREEIRVQLQALKEKEVEQLKNVHKLEKARLENELSKKEHDLREKKEELARLLVQYKTLEGKVGKSTRMDRSAEEQGKCRATLEVEILLTENIYKVIQP